MFFGGCGLDGFFWGDKKYAVLKRISLVGENLVEFLGVSKNYA